MNISFTLEIEPFRYSNDIIQHNQVDVEIWNYCISNQFPISIIEKSDGQNVILITGYPHQGYIIQTQMRDGKLNGDAIIKSPDNITVAKYQYVDNEITGECELFYDSGELFFEGSLKNGYREGFGKEYDKYGSELFIGWFEKGNSKIRWKRMNGNKRYWKEVDENDNVVSIYKINERIIKKNNINPFLSRLEDQGKISEKNREISLIYQFENGNMMKYKNNIKCYEGTFDEITEEIYIRKNGKEYDETGENVIYCGDYFHGKRHGYGISYKKGEIEYEGEWVNGLTKPMFFILFIIIPIAMFSCFALFIWIIPLFFLFKLYLVLFLFISGLLIYQYDQYSLSYYYTIVCSIKPRIERHMFSYQNECLVLMDNISSKTEIFKVNGLRKLKSLKIGRNSYNEMDEDNYKSNRKMTKEITINKLKSFHILNCVSLESIQIGEYSFCDFGGEFELSNLKSLKSIQIGTIGSRSCNFYWSSFVIRGMDMILIIE